MTTQNTTSKENISLIRTRFPKAAFYVLGLLVIVLGVFLVSSYNSPDSRVLKAVLVALPLTLFVLKEIYRRLRRSKINRTRFAANSPYYWKAAPKTVADSMDGPHMDLALNALRDSPPLLFLIDKLSEEDHQAAVYDLLYRQLAAEGQRVERYYYQGELRVFWNEAHPEGRTLEQLVNTYPTYSVVIGGDAHRAFHYETGRLHVWTEYFREWKKRIVLTNVPESAWDEHEANLATIFTLVPFTPEGVVFMSDYLREKAVVNSTTFSADPPVPDVENAPDPKLALEQYYGPELTRWIAATAICTQLSWPLTLRLGKRLSTPASHLLSGENLLLLSRLPWYRTGQIPDKIRASLISSLPPALQDELRIEIVQTLEESPPPAPSHAHNHFRMELAGHKLLLPAYPVRAVKNELYELRSLGYREDVAVTQWIEAHKTVFHRLVSRPMERYFYREGSILLGWSSWLAVPLFLAFSAVVGFAPLEDLMSELTQEPPPIETETLQPSDEGEISQDVFPQDTTTSEVSEAEVVSDTDEVIVLPDITITGKVFSLDDPKIPLRGARIRFLDREEVADASGRYSFKLSPPIPDGAKVVAEMDGFFPRSLDVAGEDRRLPDIHLPARVIHVRVFDYANQRDGLEGVSIVGNIDERDLGRGRFEITLREDPGSAREVMLRFSKRHYLDQEKPVLLSTREQRVFLQKGDDQTLYGSVRDAHTRRPIDGVVATLLPYRKTSTSNADGQFSFTIQWDDSRTGLTVVLEQEGYEPGREDFASGDNFRLVKVPRWIRGVVTGPNRLPLQGVEVVAIEINRSDVTDRAGSYAIRVQDDYEGATVTAEYLFEGCSPVSQILRVPSDGNTTSITNCEQRFTLTGKVTDPCGNGLREAEIEIRKGSVSERAITDRYGRYEATLQLPFGQAPRWNITARRDLFQPSQLTAESTGNTTRISTIKLLPDLLSGEVKDQDGQPLRNVKITLIETREEITSRGDGAFQFKIPGYLDNCEVQLSARLKNYRQTGGFTARLNTKSTSITMERKSIVIEGRVTVLNNRNEGISKVQIFYTLNNVYEELDLTDRNGKFSNTIMSGPLYEHLLDEKEIRLTAEKSGYKTVSTPWKKSNGTVEIQMGLASPPNTDSRATETITIRGKATDESGRKELSDVRIIYTYNNRPPELLIETDPQGEFSVITRGDLYKYLEEGGTITLSAERGRLSGQSITWRKGDNPVNFKMTTDAAQDFDRPTLTVRVRIRFKDGTFRAVSNEQVIVYDYKGGNPLSEGMTNDEGMAKLTGPFNIDDKIYVSVPRMERGDLRRPYRGDFVVRRYPFVDLVIEK